MKCRDRYVYINITLRRRGGGAGGGVTGGCAPCVPLPRGAVADHSPRVLRLEVRLEVDPMLD